MELFLRSASVSQGHTEAVWTVMHISAEKEPVSSTFMIVTVINSSLSPVS